MPQSFLDELVARTDLVDLVSRYVQMNKKGSDYWGCCPFHNEKTPSFHVSPARQIYKCFGCGEGGGAVQFISKIEGLSFIDAVRKLAEINGMTMPEDEYDGGAAKRRKRLLELNKDAARYYRDVLLSDEGRQAQQYLLGRGLTPQTVMRFGLGYAPDRWDGLLTAMESKGYSRAELEDARLCQRGRNGGAYDFFRDRVMFPIIDVRGDVVAFGGRVLTGDGGGRKYINSPDTPVYNKSRNLYGINFAKKTRAGRFLLCEGNIDVIALHQAGFDSAVASCGTALTPEQARLMSKYVHETVIIYDADAAGQKATEKAIDLLKTAGMDVRVLRLPPPRDAQGRILTDEQGRPKKVDPDDYIRNNGAESFARLLDKPQTDGQYRMTELRERFDLESDEGRIGYVKEAAAYIADIRSPAEREVFAHRAAQEAGVSPESVLLEVRRAAARESKKERTRIEREALTPVRRAQPTERTLRYDDVASAICEEHLLAAVLGDRALLGYVEARIAPEEFSSPFLAKIYAAALERFNAGADPSAAGCMTALDEAECRQLTALLSAEVAPASSRQALNDYIDRIKSEYEKRTGGDDALLSAARRKRDKEERA